MRNQTTSYCNNAIVTVGETVFRSNTVCVTLAKWVSKEREQAISDLLESIALQSTALSHILNAEGEKIQAMIAMDNITASQLLILNGSVTKLLSTATQLEMILQSKLSLFKT